MPNDNRVEIQGSIVACESLDVREDLAVGGSLIVAGVPVGSGVELENAGVPLAGGPFTTLNLAAGATAVDGGGGTADITVAAAAAGIAPFFGPGVDGALVFDGVSNVNLALGAGGPGTILIPAAGVYTLLRDVWASAITVNAGVVINPAGFRIFCSGLATIDGDIRSDGGVGGVGGVTLGGLGGAQAIPVGVGTLSDTASGGGGGVAGGATPGVGAIPGLAPIGIATAGGLGGTGGGGPGPGGVGGTLAGGGGGGGVAAAGASGGFATPNLRQAPSWNDLHQAMTGRAQNLSGASDGLVSSGGGGGGGGGAALVATGGGGGGGGAGGIVALFARTIAGAGNLQARGGAGGAAGGGGGQAGGGGGGAGGVVVVVTTTAALTPAIVVTGGAGGAGTGAANNGGAGGPGIQRVYNV